MSDIKPQRYTQRYTQLGVYLNCYRDIAELAIAEHGLKDYNPEIWIGYSTQGSKRDTHFAIYSKQYHNMSRFWKIFNSIAAQPEWDTYIRLMHNDTDA